jgi:protein-disulfide isomerase
MSKLRPPSGPNDHLRGELSAAIQLVEFGDFECPYCGQAYPIVKALEESLGSRLCVAFRHFPIVGSHPHALFAAEAAEAAAAQGRFWEMHDALYQHQHALELPHLEQYAASLDLDLRRFHEELRSHAHTEKIRANLHSGAVSGVNGTPTFFINGRRHDGAWDFESLYQALTEASQPEVTT